MRKKTLIFHHGGKEIFNFNLFHQDSNVHIQNKDITNVLVYMIFKNQVSFLTKKNGRKNNVVVVSPTANTKEFGTAEISIHIHIQVYF